MTKFFEIFWEYEGRDFHRYVEAKDEESAMDKFWEESKEYSIYNEYVVECKSSTVALCGIMGVEASPKL